MEAQEIQIKVNGRSIVFYFTPAEKEKQPIIFIFHGHGYNKSHSAFKSPNFNVVCPIDNFGYEGLGSWYLGEDGDFLGLRR